MNKFLLQALGIGLCLLLWQGFLAIKTTDVLPPPAAILYAGYELLVDGSLIEHSVASLRRVFLGFILGAALGIISAIIAWIFRPIEAMLTPLLESIRPIPPIAWVPLAILWFGLGDRPAIFLVSIGAFFPLFSNTKLGLQSIDVLHLRAARSLGGRRKDLLLGVYLPATLPHLFSGLRVALGFSWMCVIAAELVGAKSGLGYLIQYNRLLLRTPTVICGMIAIGLLGALMNMLILKIEAKAVPWESTAAGANSR